MCKIFSLSNASKLDLKKASEIIGNELLSIEKDGFGYAAFGEKGVFGEKSIRSNFKTRFGLTRSLPKEAIEKSHETFGVFSKVIGPAIFHGRTSTNSLGLKNCHPIQRDGWNLIHNGVVTDAGEKYQKMTDNDSEDVLYRFLSGGIDSVAKNLSGYYAFNAISPDGKLIVVRDRTAHLVTAWSDSHETHIFATTESLLLKIAKKLKMEVGPIDDFKQDHFATFSGNDYLSGKDFISLGYGLRESKFASRSLGFELDSYPDSNYSLDSTVYEAEKFYDTEDLRDELNCLDETYDIFDRTGSKIEIHEFYKLDTFSQLSCTIYREDGTSLDLDKLTFDNAI